MNIIKDVSAETLINETVTKVRRGSIAYTDRWRGYDSLMFCGYRHLNIDHGFKFKQGKVCINGVEGFWSFAKERLIKHRGISKINSCSTLKRWSGDTIIGAKIYLIY